jgi:predicted O-methyltransferase YrrM
VTVLYHYLLWQLGLTTAQTQTTEAERSCIATFAQGRRSLVEIGVWHGVTTKVIRASMTTDGILFAVDPFPRGRLGISLQQRIAHGEVNKIRHGMVKWIRAVGQEALRLASEQGLSTVDFIFVDGDHSFEGIRQDWELWTRLVSKDGIVALHDSCSTPARNIETAGSVIFTRDHILRDDRFSLVEQVDSLSVVRRR